MLAISFSELHLQGGIEYMSPITLLFVANLALAVYLLLTRKTNSNYTRWLEVHKQAGYLMLAVGVWGTLVGFFQIFDALEAIKDPLSLNVISGGVKVTLLAVVYANGLFCIHQVIQMALRFLLNNTARETA